MFTLTCPNCGNKLEAPAEAAGSKGKCGRCGEVFEIPETPPGEPEAPPERPETGPAEQAGTIKTVCPGCGEDIELPSEKEGQEVECPHCRTVFASGEADEQLEKDVEEYTRELRKRLQSRGKNPPG